MAILDCYGNVKKDKSAQADVQMIKHWQKTPEMKCKLNLPSGQRNMSIS